MKNYTEVPRTACKILFTFTPAGEMDKNAGEELCNKFFDHVRDMSGKNDLLMRYGTDQLFLF